MHVVVVESPAKAKTIEGYLGSDYKVIASFGHIRDLPSSEGSVQPDNDFEMLWEMDAKGKKQTKIIQDALKSASSLILATDPDREGEAIAWHVLQTLQDNGSLKGKDVTRVTFNAITKKIVTEAIANPRELDKELVDAYLARRALDYLVGFTLSPVLWRKLPGARSAGRVQSVALKLLCEREIEIESFNPKEYWSINALLSHSDHAPFKASLTHLDGKKLDQFDIKNSEEANKIKSKLENSEYIVKEIDEKEVSRKPSPPFITSSLQMEASRKLGMSAKNTMQVAQRLYQNGLITYMRTDGVQIGEEGINEIRSTIDNTFGNSYLPTKPNEYATKAANAQEAHEAIRPTDTKINPERMNSDSSKEERDLYGLIWKRTLASQMENWKGLRTTINITNKEMDLNLRVSGTVTLFNGFRTLYEEGRKESSSEEIQELPKLEKNQTLNKIEIEEIQHFTKAPPRFSEATLVKSLEEKGIGRPSTYASIISVLQDRQYVRIESRYFHPEAKGRLLSSFLENFFTQYVSYNFTADLEKNLDKVSNGEMNWKDFLSSFWSEFSICAKSALELRTREILETLNESIGNHVFKDENGKINRKCPKCEDGELSLKTSRNGAFVGCSSYPECKYTRSFGSSEQNVEAKILGKYPGTDDEIHLLIGRYGPYVQIGDGEGKETKPKRSSIPKTIDPADLTLEKAIDLLSLPRVIGLHPDDGNEISGALGRFGPYLLHEGVYANLQNVDELFTIGLNRAVDLIEDKRSNPGRGRGSKIIKELGSHPKDKKNITLMDGKYGPYIKHGKTNVGIPKDSSLDSITLESAIDLLNKSKKKK
jgi:DNA topoisomerase-1